MMAEFWFTAGSTFLYFTAFLAQLVDFGPYEDEEHQAWVDAQIAAGVFGLLNDVCYGLGAYLIYVDWQKNPAGMAPAAPPPAETVISTNKKKAKTSPCLSRNLMNSPRNRYSRLPFQKVYCTRPPCCPKKRS